MTILQPRTVGVVYVSPFSNGEREFLQLRVQFAVVLLLPAYGPLQIFNHVLSVVHILSMHLRKNESRQLTRVSGIQSTLSKRTLSKPDTSLNRTANLVHSLPNCTCTSVTELSLSLSKAATSLNRTVALVPRVSALERVDCIREHNRYHSNVPGSPMSCWNRTQGDRSVVMEVKT